MIEIRRAYIENDLIDLHSIIQKSFLTVAVEFGLTEETAPTNPAYISLDRVKEALESEVDFYICIDGDIKVGCIAIEKDRKSIGNYFIERLAVIPEHRHKKIGENLLDYAIAEIKNRKGCSAGVAIVNENSQLKKWYSNYGFKVNEIKVFDHLPFTVCFMSMDLPI